MLSHLPKIGLDFKLPFSVYAISVIGFFFAFTFQMITPVLPIFSVNKVGATLAEVAAIVASGFLASAVAKITTGLFIKEDKALPTLLFSYVFFTICNYLYLIAQNPIQLIVIRFIHGWCFGIIITLILSLVTFMSGKGLRGKSLGLYTGLVAVGLMTGPLVGSIIIELRGIESIFTTLTFVGVAPIILLFYLKRTGRRLETSQDKANAMIKVFHEIFSNRTVVICFVSYMIYAVFYGTISAYIPVYLNKSLGISAQTVSSIFFCFFLFAAIIRLRLDSVIKSIGDKSGILLGYINYIFFSLMIFIVQEKVLTITSIILMGVSHGIIFPLFAIRISRSVPYENLLLANSLYLIAFDIGSIIGPISTSFLAENQGIPLALAASVLPALTILPLLVLKK